MRLPTIMILGAAKAGTTSLAYYLGQHSDICMSLPKEPFFFEAEYEKGTKFYFESYFSHYKGEQYIGEARHRNLYLGYVPQRIKNTLINPRFIVICRNPTERAISHYLYNYARKKEKVSFEDEIKKNLKRLEKDICYLNESEATSYAEILEADKINGTIDLSYLDSGYYAEQIQRYIDIFGKDCIKIIFSEDLLHHTQSTVNSIFDFLNIPEKNIDTAKVNKQVHNFVPAIYRFIGNIPGVKYFPPSWRYRIKEIIGSNIKNKNPVINFQTIEYLVNHFKKHNTKLEEMTGRDLSHWNEVPSKYRQ
ncbi:MAG: sulfotransferase domain-containing protein [Desulfobacteraceae bacterium]|nr:sulfotransferase domain-containing protein [Desulfobacteraceae bacterium]